MKEALSAGFPCYAYMYADASVRKLQVSFPYPSLPFHRDSYKDSEDRGEDEVHQCY